MKHLLALLLLLPACLSTPAPAAIDGGGDDVIDAGPDANLEIPDMEIPAGAILAISAGEDHACAIDDGGRLFCWGANHRGQLGTDSLLTLRLTSPTQVGTDTGWTAIAAGGDHTCGVRDGALYCWGDNQEGEAGGGGGGHIDTPTQPAASGTGWLMVSSGTDATCGVRDDGGARRVYCWGTDYDAQLGDGDGDSSGAAIRPIAMTSEGASPTDWATVSFGSYHACATRTGGEAYCWGANGGGQLGDGTNTPRGVPTRVIADADDGAQLYTKVASGGIASCGIGTTGRLYCWGHNGYGQLGINGVPDTTVPRRVGTGEDWSELVLAYFHACGSRPSGVSCWGAGDRGALGDGGWEWELPVAVEGLDTPARVALGHMFTCAAPLTGGLSCWGDNREGQLGNGESATKHAPTQILPDGGWTAVRAGRFHTCGVQGGAAYCWGWNNTSALGPGADAVTPRAVAGIGAGTVLEIGVGRITSCALVDDTSSVTPWCWGSNLNGQVGIGPAGTTLGPTQIGTGTWSDLAVADQAACALVGTDRRCWGEGAEYQLGNNATTVVLTPTAADADAWVELGLGFHFGCGIRQTTAALACWGGDDRQQQGDGATMTDAMTPHVIASGTSFTRVATAWDGEHACAISSAGDLLCWGENGYGQCATSSASLIDTPTLVPGTGDWTDVSLGAQHTCGIKNGGELYCWGAGYDYQLGFGAWLNAIDTPTRVGSEADWSQVSAGETHSCAIRDGDLYCWGSNVHGQVGDGTSAHATPQSVLLPSP